MKERCLYNLSILERDPPAHDAEEECREGDDSQPADLEKKDRNDLTGNREVLPDIEHGKTCDANGGRGGEEGVDEIDVFTGRGEWEPQEESACQDQAGKAEDEDLSRRELMSDEASLSGIIFGGHML